MIAMRSARSSTSCCVVSLFVTCGIFFCLNGCGGKKDGAAKGPPPVPVKIAEVIQKDTPHYLKGIGRVRALKSVSIKPRVTGLLLKSHFKAGDYVKDRNVLFTIDPAPFDAKVQEAEARVNSARAEFEQAQVDLRRFESLYKEKTISPDQYEKKLLDMKTRNFLLRLHEAELETARLNLGYCSIECPLEGQTGDILVDDGNTVTAYQDTLVTVKQVKPIRVEFSLPAKYLPDIRKRAEDDQLAVQAIIPTSNKPEIGFLSLIDNLVNPKTGMIMLEGRFPNEDTPLWPGDFVNVQLKLSVTENAVLVPSQAVNEGPKGRYVWLVKKDQTVDMQPVRIDRRINGMDVVAEGLQAGDRVVTEGQLALYPGAKAVARDDTEKTEKGTAEKPGSPADGKNIGKDGAGAS